MDKSENRAFTLIELLVVIAILGVLSSIVLAELGMGRKKAQDTKAYASSAHIYRRLGAYCVGDWNFETISSYTVVDSCAGLYPGTITGATEVSGVKGRALEFDGNSHVDLGIFNVNTSGLTGNKLALSALFKASEWSSGYYDGRLIDKSVNEYDQGSYFMLSTINVNGRARLRFRVRTSNGFTTELIASSGDLELDRWYHALGIYDGSTMRLFLDGVEVGSTAKTGTLLTNNSPVYIGNNSVENRPWIGLIDDVRIYQEEI